MAAIFNNYNTRAASWDPRMRPDVDDYGRRKSEPEYVRRLEEKLMMMKEQLHFLERERDVQKAPPMTFTRTITPDGRAMRVRHNPFGGILGVEDDIPQHNCRRESHLNSFRKSYIDFLRKANPDHPLFNHERRASIMFEGKLVCCAYHIIKRELNK